MSGRTAGRGPDAEERTGPPHREGAAVHRKAVPGCLPRAAEGSPVEARHAHHAA